MNKHQKIQDQATRKILNHVGITRSNPDRGKAYRGIRKMLRAITTTMTWMETTKRKSDVNFGEMIIDYQEQNVVKVILSAGGQEGATKTVLSVIRGE